MGSRNYLAVGAEIAQRLRDQVPGLRRVLEAQDTEEAEGASKPAALVVFAGESLSQADGRQLRRGADAIVTQRWLVQLMVDNKAKDKTTQQAGYLMWDAIQALQGWKPENGISSLYRVSPPAPVYAAGYAIYPLIFELAVLADTAN